MRPLIEADIADARRLDGQRTTMSAHLDEAGEQLSEHAVDAACTTIPSACSTKRSSAEIDAMIGEKRKLDIEVQDLAAGRFPEELIGRMWNASMIGDDEEYWPFQGEFWADEYEGCR